MRQRARRVRPRAGALQRDFPLIACPLSLDLRAVSHEVTAQGLTNNRATDRVGLLAPEGAHLGACSLRLRRLATDITAREEVAGALSLRSVMVLMISR